MPLLYHFEGEDLKTLAAAAKDATQFREPYSDDWSDRPALWMVKDAGVYLINAHPNPEGRTLPLVAHCKEKLDHYDLGGDDYIEYLPVNQTQLDKLASGTAGLQVTVAKDYVEMSVYKVVKAE